jgi:hypothetical protein
MTRLYTVEISDCSTHLDQPSAVSEALQSPDAGALLQLVFKKTPSIPE